jgi:hypothetical protein
MMRRSSLFLIASVAALLIILVAAIFVPGIIRAGNHNAAAPLPPVQLLPAAVSLVTSPGVNPAGQIVTLKNNGSSALNWAADPLSNWASLNPTSGTLAVGAATTLNLNFALPLNIPQTYTTTLVVRDTGGGNPVASIPVTVVAAAPSKTWYFAEGYTGGSFTEYLTIANPNSVSANVTVTYLLGTGGPIVKTYMVSMNARFTLNVGQEIAGSTDKNVSMVVTADQPIIAERPMYFTYTGLGGYRIPGGSDVVGATSLATDFDFGYLDTTKGHDTWLTILNQNTNAMIATISYFPAAGGQPMVIAHTIQPNSRGTVHVNSEVGLSAGTYSALVHLSLPGLVERPLYLKDTNTGYTGSADVVGVAQPQTTWYFAEGYISSTFREAYIVSNPSASVSANVTLTFFLASGAPKTRTLQLAPGQQTILDASTVVGSANVNNSAQVTADAPILAERFMSFDYLGAIPGASDVLGAAAPSHLFYFAEGYVSGQFSEYLTIENPDASNTASVQVTFLPADGTSPQTQIYTVAPSTRFTLNTGDVMASGKSFSMVVVSNVAIVAERPMYFNYLNSGQTGGTDVIGYQPTAPLYIPPPPTPTPTSTNTPSPTPTSTPTNTPSPTPTNTPGSTPTPTNTPGSTPTPTNTPTPPPSGVGTISGQVTDSGDNPVAGAQISTVPASITTTTDNNGNYTLANIPAGTYNVVASASGYNTNYAANIFITNSSTATANIGLLVVPPNTSMDTFTRPNQSGWGTASDGNTWNDDHTVFPGAAPSIIGNQGYVDTYTAATDLDQWMGQSYTDELVSADFNISLLGNSPSQHGARLLGRVKDANHFIVFTINAATNTIAIWLNNGNNWAQLNQTSIFNVTLNVWYHAKLLLVGNMIFGKVWAAGTTEPDWMLSASQSSLTAGMGGIRTTFADIYWKNFSVQAVTAIVGKVMDSTNKAVAGATVTDGTQTTTTDASGNYVLIEPNTNATYTVTASANGLSSSSQSVTTTSLTHTTANFTLT